MRWLIFVGVFAAGLALGITADRLLSSPAQTVSSSPQNFTPECATSEELATLASSIESLPTNLREELRSALATISSRQVAGSTSEFDRLANAVEQLREQIERTPGDGSARYQHVVERWKGAGFGSLPTLEAEVMGPFKRGDFAALADELTAKHLLWSRADVVARYGAPIRVTAEHGLGLVYAGNWVQNGQGPCALTFWLTQDVVTHVAVSCK